jgi:hypothetical protein
MFENSTFTAGIIRGTSEDCFVGIRLQILNPHLHRVNSGLKILSALKNQVFGGFLILILCTFDLNAQQVRFDNLKEQYNKDNLLKINGGVSANAVFYSGDNASLTPFTWILSGNLNLNFFSRFNLPFSFNLNNLGGDYTYPTMPNRLSLHPSYKWVAGHIGDVSMAFSPYTLNGHQFTGAGVDLTPENLPVKISAMYGRLLKATEYNPEERLNIPAYKRMGYGAKALYDKNNISFGMTLFSARDNANSLKIIPDSLNITPQKNIAVSWEAGIKIIKNLTLSAEYGISLLTRDVRTSSNPRPEVPALTDYTPSSTYHALRASLNYQLGKNTFGFGYERVDPDYQSLGAYYFTNDLQNFTLNYARPFFADKLVLAANAGLQHDNLNNNKSKNTQQLVGAVNLNYNPNDRFNASASYSNFQTYTNIKSQFDYINEITDYDNLDTLDFTQLSQNANLSVNWTLNKDESKKHNLNFNLNYQEAADKYGEIISTGAVSRFYNLATNYGLYFIPVNLQVNTSINITYNTAGFNNMLTYGPSLSASTKLFNQKLTTGLSVAYNISTDTGEWQNSIFNLRWNVTYLILKKHNLSLVLINQNRNMRSRNAMNDLTSTFSYMYNF